MSMDEFVHSNGKSTHMFKQSADGLTNMKKQRTETHRFQDLNEKYYGISSSANQEKLFCQGKDAPKVCEGNEGSVSVCREDDHNIFETSPRTLIRSLQQQSCSDESDVEESYVHDEYDNGKWSVRDNPIACTADSPGTCDDPPERRACSWTHLKGRVLFKSPENGAQQQEEDEEEVKEEEENNFLGNSSLWSSSASSNITQPGSKDDMLKEDILNNKLQVLSNSELSYGQDGRDARDVEASTISKEFKQTTDTLEVVKSRAWNLIDVFFRKPIWITLFLPLVLVAVKVIVIHDDCHILVPT